MMSFTVLFAGFALLALLAVSALAYKLKGWKVALLAAGVTFIVTTMVFIAILYAITITM